ncbi:tyrosine-type recombinase/integrase [Ureibacillus sp. GCM10028918]|uniref:tyrosine-type recombinase/integrase n=1 Tax=Ureibacillus sp. GCM10028918 TaxID=3273429 RepID=UPI00360E16F5
MDELAAYFKGYLENLQKSPHTIKQYGIDTKQFLNFMKDNHFTFGDTLSKCITAYNEYLEERYSSAASTNRKRASLQHFLTFLEQRNIVSDIPESLLKPIQMENKMIQTLSKDQIKSVSSYWFEVYNTALDIEYRWIAMRNFCLVNLMLEIGLKPSEMIRLKWSSFKEKEIAIIQNKRARKLPLSETILNWLELFRYETEEIIPYSKAGEFVWLGLGNKQNEPITVKTIERIFQTMSQKLKFKITATIVRYTLINSEVKKNQEDQLQELFIRYGYSRKSVLMDRVKRLNLNE